MATVQTTVFRLLLTFLQGTIVSTLLCLSCSKVTDVKNCQTFAHCAPNQKCFSIRVAEGNGSYLYNLGCTDDSACQHDATSIVGKREEVILEGGVSNVTEGEKFTGYRDKRQNTDPFCHQCCDRDGCNKELCPASTTALRGLRCVTCHDALKLEHCNKIIVCGQDEYCFAQTSPHPMTNEIFYQMHCMGAQQCNALMKSSSQYCTTCCNQTDLCNYAACQPSTTSTVSSATVTLSASTTAIIPATATLPATTNLPTTTTSKQIPITTTSVQTVTPSPQLVIGGPVAGSYLSRIELQCVSFPPAQGYIWKFNQVTLLPEGVYQEKSTIMGQSVAGSDKLVISTLNESNAGLYSCIASIHSKVHESNHSITIRKEAPSVTVSKSSVTTNFALFCNVTGFPFPQIGWAFLQAGKTTKSLDLPPDVAITMMDLYSVLVVPLYRPIIHDGAWYCAAKNSLGDAIESVIIP